MCRSILPLLGLLIVSLPSQPVFCNEEVEPAQGISKMMIHESNGLIEIDNGILSFGLSTGPDATLQWVEREGKRVVDNNRQPLLSAVLMESATYDGRRDNAGAAEFFPGQYRVDKVGHRESDGEFMAELQGQLEFPGGDAFEFMITLTTGVEDPGLEIEVRLEPKGDFHNRFVSEAALRLPLDLQWRKRIAQGGDQGLDWDTRYYYEFTFTHGEAIVPPPEGMAADRNEFRHFAVEQDSLHHFRIWRAESDQTPELVHQHGLQAAGWSSVYDMEGGVLFAYPDMAARAPKTLGVEAPGSGEAVVWLYPPTLPAFSPDEKSVARQVFGEAHQTDWIFFSGEHPEARPDVLLAERWGMETPLSGERPVGLEGLWDADLELWDAPMADGQLAPYVSGGIPMPRGAMEKDTPVVLTDGETVYPCQTNPLAWWPDGSVKWLHLVFPLRKSETAVPEDLDSAKGRESFVITLRDDTEKAFTLYYGPDLEPVRMEHQVDVSENEEGIQIDTGPMQISLGKGREWWKEIVVDGWKALREHEAPMGFADFIRPESGYAARSRHAGGTNDPGPLIIDEISLEEAGPLRAVVRLQGQAQCREPVDIILRLEFYAGSTATRLFHSAEFTQADPREVYLAGMGLRLPLNLVGATENVVAGAQNGPKVLEPDAYTSLRQLSPMHYELKQWEEGVPVEAGADHRSRGWLYAGGAEGGALMVLRHMWQEFPKELSFDPATGELTAWLWPASGPVMDVRRYSDYPHRAQGESAGSNIDWVETSYYGNGEDARDPFAGTSRTHELLMWFHKGEAAARDLDTVAADFQSPPLVYSGYETYRMAGITIPMPDYQKFPEMTGNLDRFTDFWLFHQRYWNWFGIWDYGDFQHRFRGGRGEIVEPEALVELWETPEAKRNKRVPSEFVSVDYRTQQDWAFDNGRWGWTNTEGLPGLYFQQEYLRTGRRDVYFAAESLGRHARDVVTRQSGRFFGKGTRHGVQHWSDGNHEERQTTFAEYRLHYYLSGEGRSRDVMEKLGEYYGRGRARRADHSGRIYGLFTLWEMTGDEADGKRIRDYLHALIDPDGFLGYGGVRFSEEEVLFEPDEREGESRGLNTVRMFFHNFGALHGVLEYFQATGDEDLKKSLVQSARGTFKEGDPLQRGSAFLGKLAAFGALYDEERGDFFRQLIIDDFTLPGTSSRDAFRMVSANPAHWTGETAWLSRNSPLCWFYMVALPMAMAAAGEEPELFPRIWTRFHSADSEPRPEEQRLPYRPRVSWQEGYDAAELEDYFGPWRPEETRP